MEELKKYYEKSKNKWLSITAFSWTALTMLFSIIKDAAFAFINSWAVNQNFTSENYIQSLINFIFAYVAPTTAALIFYFAVIDYINKKGWKKKFPQHDISGEWNGTIFFRKSLDSKNGGWDTSIKKNEHTPVIIEQTCNTIKIKPSIGKNIEWHSIMAAWDEKGILNILYKVEYYEPLQEKNFPESRFGYETLSIDRTGLSPKQKPDKMSGKFRHCISYDDKPLFMGDVEYERINDDINKKILKQNNKL